ncbi:MAG: patatin-like phospholipase family protein [Terracidiphilus sp.]
MMRWPLSSLIILLLSLISSLPACAQSVSPGQRPTLGIVLEGGGALGLAHVGVLTWLEEHHIPVNYVAGTSMGALVGGAYATGMGAGALRKLVDNINWDQVMAGSLPYDDLSFRRKEDARDYPNNLEFGIRKGVQFPGGFNTGQDVSLIIDRLALPYSEVGSFNDLPIPFACVATNLTTGKATVFRSGSFSSAMRATMSIPGVFTPVYSKEGTYADGGLLNNLPIDVAREMGADVVLGVHLESAPLNPESLSSFSVLSQSVSIMISANELRSMEKADLLITVPLSKYKTLDFRDAGKIIQAGYDAAAAKEKMLMRFAVDQAAWDQYIAARNARRRTIPVPKFVAVSGTNPNLSRQVETNLAPLVDKPIDFNDLNQRILELNGRGHFSSISYEFTRHDGQQGLQMSTTEKTYAPPLVQPLILINGSSYNNAEFNIGARITFLDFGGFRSELRNDIILFSQYALRSEYYHPFTPKTHWFIAPRIALEDLPIYIYEQSNQIATYRQQSSSGAVDFGHIYGRTGELRLGYEGGWQKYRRQSGDPTLPTFSGPFADLRLQYTMDRLDEAVLPRAGRYLLGTFRWYNVNPVNARPFPSLQGASLNYFKINDPSSVFLNGYAGTTFGYDTGIPQFSLGGSVRMIAYGENELLINEYYMGQAGYMRRIAKLPPLIGSGVYAVFLVEGGQVFGEPLTGLGNLPQMPGDIAGAVIAKSIFGPAQFGYSYGEAGHHKFYFRIGRIF